MYQKKSIHAFLLLFLFILSIPYVLCETDEEINFPLNIIEIEYSEIIEYNNHDYNYGYKISENLKYEIINVDAEDNSFDVKLTSEYSLLSTHGLEIRRIDAHWDDTETQQYPFSNTRKFQGEITRRVDLSNGNVLGIFPDSFDADSIVLVFTVEVFEDEISHYLSGYSSVGYAPFSWKKVFQPDSYSPSDREVIWTSAGDFTCYIVEDEDYVHYYDIKSGLCIKWSHEFSDGIESVERSSVLVEVVRGRTWDNVKIVSGGITNDEPEVKESSVIWFKAVYGYDDEILDSSKGSLFINDESAQWSDSNERWELEWTSETTGAVSFKVSNIIDEKYGLTSINDVAGELTIEWMRAREDIIQNTGIELYVKDNQGGSLVGASVTSISAPNEQASLSGIIGIDGSITFTGIKSGSYDIQVEKDKFVTESETVTVKVDEISTHTITLKKQGIPGFPLESIAISFILMVLMLWLKQKQQ